MLKVCRVFVLSVGLAVLLSACGDSESSDTSTTTPTASSQAGSDGDAPSTTAAAPTTAVPTTVALTTTSSPPTTQAAFEPPPFVTLDDGILGMEPPDTSYRATLLFTMNAVLDDGTVQEGITVADGGKIINPDDASVAHSFVVDTEGLTDLPDCVDLAALSPNWISVYDTFYGGDAGDLAGDAMLSEAGIMTNGVVVDRYAITLDNIKPEESNDYESLTEAYVDVAREGGYLVSLVLSGTGFNNTFTVDQSEPRAIVFELNFLEFDSISEFTVPQGCVP